MKELYEVPVIEVVEFSVEEIMDESVIETDIETDKNETPWG